MKFVQYFLSVMVIVVLFAFQAQAQTTYEKASEAYRNEDYKQSIILYEQVAAQSLSENKESAEVYYNLGNAYFRDGQTAKAILNYERALLIKPGDADIRHNLRFARTRIEDKIDTASSFFLTNWIESLRNSFSSNSWAAIGIMFFVLFLVCLALYLFMKKVWIRKASFYAGLVVLLLVFVANAFAFSQRNGQLKRNQGIIMSASASVMNSPDTDSKEIFRLHEGTKVKLREIDGNWYEIEIANGNVGWTSKENIEII